MIRNNIKQKRIVFFGTPAFAVPFLDTLISKGYNVVSVVTQPDKKVGRNHKSSESRVKVCAKTHDIPVLTPKNLKKNPRFKKQLADLKPDLAIVVAYGKIIPSDMLHVPKLGFINIHPSLLPKYRGPSPIQWALLNGDKKTGITIMQLDKGMDSGDIFYQKEISIAKNDNAKTLHDKIATFGSTFLADNLPKILKGMAKPIQQDATQARYSQLITRNDAKIDFSDSAAKIEQMGQAYYPWPGLFTYFNDKRVKIVLPKAMKSKKYSMPPGTFFLTENGQCAIMCSAGYIIPQAFQVEGKRELTNKEFVQGYFNG